MAITVESIDQPILQRDEGQTYKSMSFAGTYDSSTQVECRLMGLSGTPYTAWENATLNSGAGTWNYEYQAPQGYWLRLEARYVGSGTIVAQSIYWAVGVLIALDGQSNSNRPCAINSGSPYTQPTGAYRIYSSPKNDHGPTQTWYSGTAHGTGNIFARCLANKPGIPVGLVFVGTNGASMENTLEGVAWTNTANTIAAVGGAVEQVFLINGEQDAKQATTPADYYEQAVAYVDKIRTEVGRPNMRVSIYGANLNMTYAGTTPQTVAAIRASQEIVERLKTAVTWCGQGDGLTLLSDGVHYTADANGTGKMGIAIGNHISAFI